MDRRAFVGGAAALVLAPRGLARLAADQELALVTADEEARLVALELRGGRVRRYVATLPKPRSIEAVGPMAVVAHSEIGAVTIVRGATLAVEHVLRGFGEPRYTAAHPDGRHAYITDAERGEVVVVDVLRGRVVGRERVGALARHLTIDPRGRRLWVALGAKAEEIAAVDVGRRARPRLVRRFQPPFLAHDVGWAPGGNRVWVSSGDRREVAIYHARTGALLKRLHADEPPQHFTFQGDRIYVASGESGTLSVHSVDGSRLGRTRIPEASYNVQHGHGWVVTPALGRGTVTLLDRRGRLVWRRTVARSSHDACFVVAQA